MIRRVAFSVEHESRPVRGPWAHTTQIDPCCCGGGASEAIPAARCKFRSILRGIFGLALLFPKESKTPPSLPGLLWSKRTYFLDAAARKSASEELWGTAAQRVRGDLVTRRLD